MRVYAREISGRVSNSNLTLSARYTKWYACYIKWYDDLTNERANNVCQ